MNHSFSVEIATKYGMLEAILLEHLNFWIAKNKANETNFYDGLYWTYSSTKALSQLFPYVSQKSISRALHHLKDEGLIAFGNYNKSSYDRTMWYALTEKGDLVISGGDLHLSEGKMENPEKENQNSENVQPIPDISTYTSTDKSKIENPTDSCPEPEEPAAEPEPEEPEPEEPSAELEPPFITLPLNTGEEHPVTAGDVEEYKELYPAVNIEQALRSMRGWLLSNPGRRKTARGIRRFINSWLSREQDRGGNMRAPARAARSDLEAWANG